MTLLKHLLSKVKWNKGRQLTGYQKFTFWAFPRFDCHLLYYGENVYLPPHTDTLTYANHYRINIILVNSAEGGEFKIDKTIFQTNRIKFFRPDVYEHEVTKVTKGYRLVLSIGFAI